MRKTFRVIVSLVFLSGWAAAAEAAVVLLKDGSRLQGTVVGATARDVQLHTPDGTLTINAERILRIDYGSASEQEAAEAAPAPARSRARSSVRRAYEDPKQLLSLGFGLNVPASRISLSGSGGGRADNGDTGLLMGAQYVYYLTPRLGAGVHFEYFNRSDHATQSLIPLADSAVSGDSLAAMAVLRYTLIDRGGARPYILAGVGPGRTSTVVESRPLEGFIWPDTPTDEARTLVDDSDWGLASTVRLGIDFQLMEPAIFSVEAGWTGLSHASLEPTAAGRVVDVQRATGDLSVINFAARWGWRF